MSRTKGELLKMLQFLDSADVEDDRVECAIQLALDPSIRRRKRVSAEEVFRNRTSLACQVWQGFTDHAHSRLLLNTLGYDNYAVDIAGALTNQLNRAAAAVSTWRGRQIAEVRRVAPFCRYRGIDRPRGIEVPRDAGRLAGANARSVVGVFTADL